MKLKYLKDNIRVYTRLMPIPASELEQGFRPIVEVDNDTKIVTLKTDPLDQFPRKFQFTDVFDENTSQESIYERTAMPIIQDFLHGYNCVLFTYGHAGTGKTYTIEGDPKNEETEGIMPRVFRYLFNYISSTYHEDCILRASYLEIYAENYRDLLLDEKKGVAPPKIEIFHSLGKTQFHGITEYIVNSPKELRKLLRYGSSRRTKTVTSSDTTTGSHTIFKLILERRDKKTKQTKVSELSFADLAGTDKFTEGELTPEKLRQCSKINLSLFELGNVINLITENSPYIPFRNSKLTAALRNCLGGNAKTSIVTTVNPFISHYSETLSSFLFAARARQIVNCPVINEDPRDSLIRSLRVKIAQLRQQLLNEKNRSLLTAEEKKKIDEITQNHQRTMAFLNEEKDEEDRKHEETRMQLENIIKQKEEVEKQNEKLQEQVKILEAQIKNKPHKIESGLNSQNNNNDDDDDDESQKENKFEDPQDEIKNVELQIANETKKYLKDSKEMQSSIKKKTKDIAFLNFVISQFLPDQLDKTLPVPVVEPLPDLPNEEVMVDEYQNSIRILKSSKLLTGIEEEAVVVEEAEIKRKPKSRSSVRHRKRDDDDNDNDNNNNNDDDVNNRDDNEHRSRESNTSRRRRPKIPKITRF